MCCGSFASPFESVTYSADGAQIISGHADGSVAISNSASRALIVTLVSADGERAAITPEGFFDASAKGSALLHVVNGLDVVSIDQVFRTCSARTWCARSSPAIRKARYGEPPPSSIWRRCSRAARRESSVCRAVDGRLAPEDHATVKIELTARDGGIGRVEWRVVSVTRAVDRNAQDAAADTTIQLDHTFPLEQGDNTVEEVAYRQGLAGLGTRSCDDPLGWACRCAGAAAVCSRHRHQRLLRQPLAAELCGAGRQIAFVSAGGGRTNLFPVIKVATPSQAGHARSHPIDLCRARQRDEAE